MSNDSIDDETAQEVRDDLEAADDDVSRWQRLSAGAQLALLFGGIGAALAGAVRFGYITPDVAVEATVNIGWVVEYLAIALVGLFLLYVFSLFLIWLPGSIINALSGLAYGVAKQQGLVEDE